MGGFPQGEGGLPFHISRQTLRKVRIEAILLEVRSSDKDESNRGATKESKLKNEYRSRAGNYFYIEVFDIGHKSSMLAYRVTDANGDILHFEATDRSVQADAVADALAWIDDYETNRVLRGPKVVYVNHASICIVKNFITLEEAKAEANRVRQLFGFKVSIVKMNDPHGPSVGEMI